MTLEQQTAKPIRVRERIGLAAIGHTLKQVEEFLFDWLLYGAVAAWATMHYGSLWGSLATFAIMTPLSGLICLIYLWFYDLSKKDWFGFEALKSVKEEMSGGGFWKKLMRAILRLGDFPAFILLSITSDPFMTTLYLRKGAGKYDGMTTRDKWIFFGSLLLSNGYWTLRWSVIVVFGIWIWSYMPKSIQELVHL